jgi:hypothetical protein
MHNTANLSLLHRRDSGCVSALLINPRTEPEMPWSETQQS